ncbi:hypothetical protein [Massilia psychrophila]|uniref:Lipoprotein n=1 Tax=Massilia psychrophila TaxID=1603353 RepID=A0A2G8SYZ5_9BURK|nr:hypothetical protein [Massilia psychrophila]PIL38952.1 hypothetical protein CR103_15530 [Massilia psychrophila]GGE71833.1 hypothetical protein GCM10008020_15600 [Massilia psychrophila]
MNMLKTTLGAVLAMLLSGCLEVEQHPPWLHGQYAGKPDNRTSQVSFHNDKMAWSAAISNRSLRQNEYNRSSP